MSHIPHGSSGDAKRRERIVPQIKSLSEFNRNQTAVIEELRQTGEPLYLTRNGSASVVVMDAAAFDEQMSFRKSVYAEEMRVYKDLMSGYGDYLEGDIVEADEAEAAILAEKGCVRS